MSTTTVRASLVVIPASLGDLAIDLALLLARYRHEHCAVGTGALAQKLSSKSQSEAKNGDVEAVDEFHEMTTVKV